MIIVKDFSRTEKLNEFLAANNISRQQLIQITPHRTSEYGYDIMLVYEDTIPEPTLSNLWNCLTSGPRSPGIHCNPPIEPVLSYNN